SETALSIVLSGKFSSFGFYQEVDEASRHDAEKILHQLGLTYLKDRTYDSFSQGEERRILIGRALMGQPDLLIVDEHCSAQDVRAREDVLNIVRDRKSVV